MAHGAVPMDHDLVDGHMTSEQHVCLSIIQILSFLFGVVCFMF